MFTAKPVVSKWVMGATPLLPARRFCHDSAASRPTAVSNPTPVTTTLRFKLYSSYGNLPCIAIPGIPADSENLRALRRAEPGSARARAAGPDTLGLGSGAVGGVGFFFFGLFF